MPKVQLTLTDQESLFLSQKAQMLGYDTTKYIKFLISQEAYHLSDQIPTYPMSPKTEVQVAEALSEYGEGKGYEMKDVDELDVL